MRQLSAPGRLAVWIVTSVAALTSAGCMSVGDDAGSPAPSRPADRSGAATEPDGGTGDAAGVGGADAWPGHTDQSAGGTARAEADGAAGADGKGGAGDGATEAEAGKGPSPEAGSSAVPSPRPSTGARPQPGNGKPTAPGNEPVPTREPTRSAPPPVQPTQTPAPVDPDPEPEPTKPQEPPSASPAAEMRMAAMALADGAGMMKEPSASAQPGPV
ncbi:hypothetical protein [Streptomyces sp. NPDC059092]|uniref:hypothetical protein n=1 Tax=Streptomyces sp. NPDC059092 TaxID=3346725 RepID=UPI00368594AA